MRRRPMRRRRPWRPHAIYGYHITQAITHTDYTEDTTPKLLVHLCSRLIHPCPWQEPLFRETFLACVLRSPSFCYSLGAEVSTFFGFVGSKTFGAVGFWYFYRWLPRGFRLTGNICTRLVTGYGLRQVTGHGGLFTLGTRGWLLSLRDLSHSIQGSQFVFFSLKPEGR